MLAPYTNIGAFMKEWRSRAPPTYRGFGNQSSAVIASNNQSSAPVVFSRNPQEENLGAMMGSGGDGTSDDAVKIMVIVFGTFGGIILLSSICGTWLLIRHRRKILTRQARQEAARDVTGEQVPALHSSTESSSPLPRSSSSSNASPQHSEGQPRGTSSPSAIDGPTSRRPSLQASGPVDNWVDGMIRPSTSGGFSNLPAPPTIVLAE
ncbi:hypothetical protein QM012_000361 [Aureobasidium pullulans]|uniref:Uncharacterized protein n=1 Tax=Aureobasidium pullulans TaxID=5580 RepID=A0ABR0TVD9_AURPU